MAVGSVIGGVRSLAHVAGGMPRSTVSGAGARIGAELVAVENQPGPVAHDAVGAHGECAIDLVAAVDGPEQDRCTLSSHSLQRCDRGGRAPAQPPEAAAELRENAWIGALDEAGD